jgi:hypothetical protein
MSGTGLPVVSPCGLQVLVLTAQMGTIEIEAKGGRGNRGTRKTVKQKYQEPVHKQAVSPCGLQVLALTAQMGTMEVEVMGGQGGRGRETVQQKCWELVYQRFPPVVFKCWY